jgi:MFS family permease
MPTTSIPTTRKSWSDTHRKTILSTMVVLASMLFLLYKYVLQISPSVMMHPLMAQFHLNGMAMGALTASWFWTMLVFQFIAGPMLDRYSAKWVGALALIISATGALAFSYSTTLHAALWARSLMGVGAAFATVSYLKLTADWFTGRSYAIICGLLITGVMLGSMLAQSPLALLVTHVGWQRAVLLCSILGFVIAAIYYMMIPSQTTAVKYQSNAPAKQTIRLKDCLSVLKSSKNWWLMFYSGLAFTPLAAFGGLWGNACLERLHQLTSIESSLMTSCLFMGLGVGGPLLGFLSDRLISRKNCMYLGLLLTFVGFVTVIYLPIHSTTWIGTELFIAGLGTSAFMLGFGVGKDINSLSLAATVVCMINTGDSVLGALTEPLIGRLLDITGSPHVVNGADIFTAHGYYLSMAILPLFVVLAAVCVFRLRDQSPQSAP